MLEFTKRVLAFLLKYNSDKKNVCVACKHNQVIEKDCLGFYTIGLSYLFLASDLCYGHNDSCDYEIKIKWDNTFKGYIPEVYQKNNSEKVVECHYTQNDPCLFDAYLCKHGGMAFIQNYISLDCDLNVDFDFDNKLCFIKEGIINSNQDQIDLYVLYAIYINNLSWILHDNDKEHDIRFDKLIDSLFRLGVCLNPESFLSKIEFTGEDAEFNYLLDVYADILRLQKNVIKFREDKQSNKPFANYFNNRMITELNNFLGLSLVPTCKECDKILTNNIIVDNGRYGDLRKNISDFKPNFKLFSSVNLKWCLKRKLKKVMKMNRKNEKNMIL